MVLSLFYVSFGVIFRAGYARGYTKWLRIFVKVVMQKWVFRGCDIRGGRYCFLKDMCVFRTDSPPLNATSFLSFTLLNNTISDSLLFLGYIKEGEDREKREKGRDWGAYRVSSRYSFSYQRPPLMTLKTSIRRSQCLKTGHWRQAFLFQ